MTAVDDVIAELNEARAASVGDLTDIVESWQAVDLAPVVTGERHTPTPDVLHTRDTLDAYFYRGCVNSIHGDSGIGKSWVAMHAVAQVLERGRRAVIVDYESNPAETVERLLALGVHPDRIIGQLVYIQPNAPTSDLAIALVLDAITDDTDLVVIDSLGEAFGLDGIDENSDADVGPWLRRVARQLAAAGPAVLLIDHSTKASDNPLHPSGSKRKRAAVTGASYLVLARSTPTRETAGTLTLTCAKDRHGTYPRGKHVATIDITPYPDGGLTVNVHQAPTDAPDETVLVVARAIVRLVKTEGRAMSSREVIERSGIKARNGTKYAALDLAVGRGALTVTPGPRNAKLHTYVTDLDDEPTHAQ